MKKSPLRSGLSKSFNLLLGCAALITISTSTANAVTPGCNPDVWTAMKGRAESQLAYDVAVMEEIIRQPDSVLAMTCFDQSMNVSAQNGGQIFSGVFNDRMAQIVGRATENFVDNNFTYAEGHGNPPNPPTGHYATFGDIIADMDTGTVGGVSDDLGTMTGFSPTPGSTPAAYNCTFMQDLWNDVMTDGINEAVPYISFEELVTAAGGTMPSGAGTLYQANIVTEASIITTADTNITALPVPTVPTFAANQTLEQVLTTAGILP